MGEEIMAEVVERLYMRNYSSRMDLINNWRVPHSMCS